MLNSGPGLVGLLWIPRSRQGPRALRPSFLLVLRPAPDRLQAALTDEGGDRALEQGRGGSPEGPRSPVGREARVPAVRTETHGCLVLHWLRN